MKRTALFFALAGAMALSALILGRHPSAPVVTPPPITVPLVTPPTPPTPPVTLNGSGLGSLRRETHLSDPVLALGGTRDEYLKIDLTGADVDGHERAAVNVAVVLDRSGSMAGEKLENARRAAHVLVDRLNEHDRLAFVTFGSNVTPLFPSTPCTADARGQMHRAIDKIYDMGGTNLSGGLEAGLREVEAHAREFPVNRVILISDGEANEGITSREGLVGISRHAMRDGVSVTALGVGFDFDEDVMQALAENGGGNYRYLRTGGELEEIFNTELKQLAAQVASSPSLVLGLPQGVQLAEVFGYAYQVAGDGAPTIQLTDFAAAEHRKVIVRLSVPANQVGNSHIADVQLHYTDLLANRRATTTTASLQADISADVQAASSRRDRTTYAQVARVQAASYARKAATLYSAGKVDDAREQLDEARLQANNLNQVAGDATLGADLDKIAPSTPMPSQPTSEAGRSATKLLKQESYDAFR